MLLPISPCTGFSQIIPNAMPLAKIEIQQLLERLIFEESSANDWVQDVWGLSPLLGDSAAKLLEVFQELVERCPEDQLESLLQTLYENQMQ